MIKIGSKGPDVILVQKNLVTAGFSPGPIDGIFGALTDAAVRRFQAKMNLGVDGIVGPITLAALNGEAPSPKPAPDTGSLEFNFGSGEYSTLLKSAKISHGHDIVTADAKKILWYKSRYESVADHFSAPWIIIGVIHLLEAGLNFTGVLHNGERIIGTGKKTTLVPKGRGPFATWEDAAIDALTLQKMNLVKVWEVDSALSFLEHYNGMGYRSHGIHSPYLWSFTNQYSRGKYTSDGHWDSGAVSQQVGCCAILLAMKELGVHLPGIMV